MIPQPTYQAGLIFLFVFMMMGCLHLHKQNPLFEALSPEHTGIDFVNILAEADTFSIIDYIYYYNGGGVGIADFNGDGLEDIIFTANETSIRLYLNQGDFIFTDVTEIAGVTTNTWVTGINIADINGDGWPDFYLCVAGSKHADKRKNLLFIHAGFDEAGIPYFTEQADDWGVADTGYSTQSVFFDFNNDGLLDLFVMNHANNKSVVNNPLPLKWDEPGESNDRLYRNNGNGTFTDVTIESGIIGEGYGLGVCIHDFNGDGWPDIYVANDFIYNDHLWINQGNGTFINESSLWLPVQSYNSMGCDMADLNHSGFQDLLVLDMMPLTWKDYKLMTGTMTWAKWNIMMTQGYSPQYMRNTLFKNNGIVPGDSGGYPFFEIAHYARIARTDWSWAPLFADFDNDGYSDLYISNGYYRDITDQDFTDYTGHLIYFSDQERSNQQIWEEVKKRNGLHTPNRMFNNKRNYRFEDMTGHWIHSHPSFSNGAAYVDLNNDGFPDLVVNNINEKATLYRNNGSNEKHSGNYIQIHLNGPKENKTGIGTKLVCKTASFQQTLYQYPVRGFQSSVSAKLHFGLGDEAVIQELSIVWPDGKQQTLKDIPANQLISIFYENAMELKANNAHSTSPPPVFQEITGLAGLDYTWTKSGKNNFLTEPLIPYQYSDHGPVIKVGDLSGNGLDDIFIGCNEQSLPSVFLQQTDGSFQRIELKEVYGTCVDAIIQDVNCTGRNQLLIATDWKDEKSDNPLQALTLFEYDHQKGFVRQTISVRDNQKFSQGKISLYQTDHTTMMCVSGSIMEDRYPLTWPSQIWKIECGLWELIEPDLIKNDGIAIKSVWWDIDHNGNPELLVAGHWMGLKIFKENHGQWMLWDNPVQSGWWNDILIFPYQGSSCFLLANEGQNYVHQPSAENPLILYYGDLDGNGRSEAVMAYTENMREYPAYKRNQLLGIMAFLELKFPKHRMYAESDMLQIAGIDRLNNSLRWTATSLAHCIYCYEGENGWFKMEVPEILQSGTINNMHYLKPGKEDSGSLVLLGNNESRDLSAGYQLGWNGKVLPLDHLNKLIPDHKSGLIQSGEVSGSAVFNKHNMEIWLLMVSTSGKMKAFQYRGIPVRSL